MADGVKLFVGHLPTDLSEDEFRHLGDGVGPCIDAHILVDKETGRSKGCGFLKFASLAAAEAAIRPLIERTLDPDKGQLSASIAKGEAEKHGFHERSAGEPPEYKLFVGSMPKVNFEEREVRELFSSYGTVEKVYLFREQDGSCKGAGFVTMGAHQELLEAIEALDGRDDIGGAKPLEVRIADKIPKAQKGKMGFDDKGKGKGKGFDDRGKGKDFFDDKGKGKGDKGKGKGKGKYDYDDYGGKGKDRYDDKGKGRDYGYGKDGPRTGYDRPPPERPRYDDRPPPRYDDRPPYDRPPPREEYRDYRDPRDYPRDGYGPPRDPRDRDGPYAREPPRDYGREPPRDYDRRDRGYADQRSPRGAAAAMDARNDNPRERNGWKEYLTDDNRTYYHHAGTNKTQWDKPPGWDDRGPPPPPRDDYGRGGGYKDAYRDGGGYGASRGASGYDDRRYGPY